MRAVVLENTIGVTESSLSAEIGKHAGQSTGRAGPWGATGVRDEIKSPAFQNAELQSERIRIFGILGFIAIFIVVTALRVFVIRTATRTTPWVWTFLLAAIVIAYESWMLRKVDLALKATGSLGAQFWILSTILETSIPAFAVAFLTSAQVEVAYRPLASPAVLVFFIFIILSTLRLNPRIAILSGIVAAVTYICAALYLGWRPPLLGAPAPVTQTSVSLNVITLLVGGLVAGAVAGQIRKHVQSALREAETKRKLDAIEHDLQVARSISSHSCPRNRLTLRGSTLQVGIVPPMTLAGITSTGRHCPMGKWWSASPTSPDMV